LSEEISDNDSFPPAACSALSGEGQWPEEETAPIRVKVLVSTSARVHI
jgi:hypothetical protein